MHNYALHNYALYYNFINVSNLFEYVLFADDTTLSGSDVNFAYLVSNVNFELGNAIVNRIFRNALDKSYISDVLLPMPGLYPGRWLRRRERA